jgi:3-oxoacyl-[acyl-carrier-protein] synthase II
MTDRPTAALAGMDVVSAFGHGTKPLLDNVLTGRAAFGPVRRFDVADRRVGIAATAPGSPVLLDELAGVVEGACDEAGLTAAWRAETPLLLAVHGDPALARAGRDERPARSAGAMAAALADRCGLSSAVRAYTSACVAASTAMADAGTMIASGRAERIVVAAGYLVEPDQFALFDAGRALAVDGQVRPFSARRTGLLLGDGVAAVVLEAGSTLRRRGGTAQAWLAGWGRAGDAYHVCRPDPTGAGLARAIGDALRRGQVSPADVGYLNAHGSGTPHSDAAESAAVRRAFGPLAGSVPVSSTKSVIGQALEAAGLVELIVTAQALRRGELPVNAGFLAPDVDCPLDVIVDAPRPTTARYALSLNSAFGGANTALLVATP